MAKKRGPNVPNVPLPAMGKKRYTDAEIAAALVRSSGLVSPAAKALGCAPVTIRRRIEKSEKLRDVLTDARETLIDMAEIKLNEAVLGGEAWAIKLVLQTLGKERGYVERVEQTGKSGGPLRILVEYGDEDMNDGDDADDDGA